MLLRGLQRASPCPLTYSGEIMVRDRGEQSLALLWKLKMFIFAELLGVEHEEKERFKAGFWGPGLCKRLLPFLELGRNDIGVCCWGKVKPV